MAEPFASVMTAYICCSWTLSQRDDLVKKIILKLSISQGLHPVSQGLQGQWQLLA